MIFKQLHLIISALIVFAIAMVYGFHPSLLFDVKISSFDEHSIFKAIMGLYFAFATLWTIGILKPAFWKIATISNMIFMLGLAFGRIIAMIMDGLPTPIFLVGTVG